MIPQKRRTDLPLSDTEVLRVELGPYLDRIEWVSVAVWKRGRGADSDKVYPAAETIRIPLAKLRGEAS